MKSQIELETKVKQIFHNHGEGQAQEAYTGEIIQERRSFKPTFEAVTSPPAQLYGAYDRYYSSKLYFQQPFSPGQG